MLPPLILFNILNVYSVTPLSYTSFFSSHFVFVSNIFISYHMFPAIIMFCFLLRLPSSPLMYDNYAT